MSLRIWSINICRKNNQLHNSADLAHESLLLTTALRLNYEYNDTQSILMGVGNLENKKKDDQESSKNCRRSFENVSSYESPERVYISECGAAFPGERKIPPLHQAAWQTDIQLIIHFGNLGRNIDDIDIFTHSNYTLTWLRREILRRIKAN